MFGDTGAQETVFDDSGYRTQDTADQGTVFDNTGAQETVFKDTGYKTQDTAVQGA